MKKSNVSFFIFMMAAALFSLTALTGCKFNLTKNNYLARPDVEIKDKEISIRGAYESTKIEYITVYRQEVTDSGDAEILRIGVIFPAGFDKENQTYIFYDSNIFYGVKYHYYVRFTEQDGSKNRTEWSRPIQNTTTGVKDSGSSTYKYTAPAGNYTYDPALFTLKLPAGQDFTVPTAIDNYSAAESGYKPALVFQHDDVIQVFEVEDPTDVNLKDLLPQDFLYVDVKLLGILGQRIEYSVPEDGEDPELKYITWTELTPVKVENQVGNELKVFRLDPKHGNAGFDYSINSDNEKE